MAVNGGETATLVVVYPPFQGGNSPCFGIVKHSVQCCDWLIELDNQCLIGLAHSQSSFFFSHSSRFCRHSSNVGFTQEKSSPSVWR